MVGLHELVGEWLLTQSYDFIILRHDVGYSDGRWSICYKRQYLGIEISDDIVKVHTNIWYGAEGYTITDNNYVAIHPSDPQFFEHLASCIEGARNKLLNRLVNVWQT